MVSFYRVCRSNPLDRWCDAVVEFLWWLAQSTRWGRTFSFQFNLNFRAGHSWSLYENEFNALHFLKLILLLIRVSNLRLLVQFLLLVIEVEVDTQVTFFGLLCSEVIDRFENDRDRTSAAYIRALFAKLSKYLFICQK